MKNDDYSKTMDRVFEKKKKTQAEDFYRYDRDEES